MRGRLTMTDADRITTTIGRLDAHFTAIGCGALLTVATAYIDRLRDTTDGCTYDPRVEQVGALRADGPHPVADDPAPLATSTPRCPRRGERATLLVDQIPPQGPHPCTSGGAGPPPETCAPAWPTIRSSTPCCSSRPPRHSEQHSEQLSGAAQRSTRLRPPGSRPVQSHRAVVSWCGCRSLCRGRR